MSDHMMRGVRVQLTTTMDSLLRTTVFEVMRIFESALYNHKMEMAHKGEEIAQLKVKLQTAELKLKESDQKKQSGAERNKSQTEPEVVPDVPEQSTTVPEIDVEVPDDWCAPLGYDTPNKQEEGFCPSVRLKQFSIRLSPVPLVKHEVANRTIDLQRSPGVRRSKRISTTSGTQTRSPVKEPAQASQPPKIGKDLKRLLQGLNEDYCNLKGLDRLRNRKTSEVNYTAKEEEDEESPLQINEQKNHQASESDAAKPQRAKLVKRVKYTCGECYKVFDKKRGLNLHKRYQKTCRGCNMAFCFLNAANCHTRVCEKYKALKKTKWKRSAKTANEENVRSTTKTKKVKNGTAQFSVGDGKPSIQRFVCQHCGFKTKFPKKFKKHMRRHDNNNDDNEMLTCSICQKWSGLKRELKKHMKSMHGVGARLTDKKGELGRSKPLEDGEEGRGFSHSQ
ncbi:uncharacterized protein V3H82_005678 [Fundulus diaphanus]